MSAILQPWQERVIRAIYGPSEKLRFVSFNVPRGDA